MKYLNKYSAKKVEIQEFLRANAQVFAQFESMQRELGEIEELLKAEARVLGHGAENDTVVISVTNPIKGTYDFDVIRKEAKPAELKVIEATAIHVEVDPKQMRDLVKKGAISVDLERLSYKEVVLTPRVTIKEKEQDHAEDAK